MGNPLEELEKREQHRIFALAIMERLKTDDYYTATTLAIKYYKVYPLDQIKAGLYDNQLNVWYDLEIKNNKKGNTIVNRNEPEKNMGQTIHLKSKKVELEALNDNRTRIIELAQKYSYLYDNSETNKKNNRAM